MPSLSRSLGFTVWVSEAALEAILTETDTDPERETGGVLMGYWAEDSAVITTVIGPGPRAIRSKRRFRPDARWQGQEIAKVYQESGRTLTYLGDWHSHPGRLPLPSVLDVRTARRIAMFKESKAANPLMLIVGACQEHELLLATYRYERRGLRPCKFVAY